MPGLAVSYLSFEEIDDLIYFSRIADLNALESTIQTLSEQYSCSPASIITRAIDVDSDGLGSSCSLLHYPSANGNVDILKLLLSLAVPLSVPQNELVQICPLVNSQNSSGNTPLHWAALNGHLECVKLLISARADPSITNGAGHDAVFEAEMGGKEGCKEVAEWILRECAGLEKGAGGQSAEREENAPANQDKVRETTETLASPD